MMPVLASVYAHRSSCQARAAASLALAYLSRASMSQSGWWRQPPKRCGSWTVSYLDSMGARMRADGILNFHHSEVAAVLRLEGAWISGELCLDHATLGSGTGDIVLAAENLIVDGPLNCRGIISRGAISLRGAHISGTIDATDAKIPSGTPKALDANYAFIGGRFLGNGMAVEGEIRLRHARIGGSLDLAGARLHNPGGHSLGCGGAAIEGGVWCVKGFEAEGQLRFIGARHTHQSGRDRPRRRGTAGGRVFTAAR